MAPDQLQNEPRNPTPPEDIAIQGAMLFAQVGIYLGEHLNSLSCWATPCETAAIFCFGFGAKQDLLAKLRVSSRYEHHYAVSLYCPNQPERYKFKLLQMVPMEPTPNWEELAGNIAGYVIAELGVVKNRPAT